MKRIKKDSSALKIFWCVLLGCSLFVLCFSLLEKAKADEYLYTGAWSYHANDKERHLKNETHRLIAYEKDGVMVGTFKNSYYDQTYLIAKTIDHRFIKPYNTKYINLEFKAALTYGYYQCFGGKTRNDNTKNFCPAIVTSVSSDKVAVQIGKYSIQPAYMMMGSNVHILSLRTKF